MLAELQTSSDRLNKMVETTLREKLSTAVVNPLTIVGQEVWVVQSELLGETSVDSEAGSSTIVALGGQPAPGYSYNFDYVINQRIFFVQEIQLHLASRSGAVFTPFATPTLRLSLELTLNQIENVGLQLQIALGTVELLGNSDATLQMLLDTNLRSLIQTSSQTIPCRRRAEPADHRRHPRILAVFQPSPLVLIRGEYRVHKFHPSLRRFST
jgi:hypothetical protein